MKSNFLSFLKKRIAISNNLPEDKIIFPENMFLEVNHDFPIFSLDRISTSESTAFIRPLKRFINNGRPIGHVYPVVYKNKSEDKYYVLGSLCHTHYAQENSRIIFFPGLQERTLGWHSKQNLPNLSGIIDHFTIEPDEKSWHYTILKKQGKKEKYRLPDNKINEISPGIFSWFSMSLRREHLLESLYRRYNLKIEVPQDKYNDYVEKLSESKKDTITQIIEQPYDDPSEEEFIHIDFLIDKRESPDSKKLPRKLCLVPYKNPALVDDLREVPSNFPVRNHSIDIKGFSGKILILVSSHKGKLAEDVIIGARSFDKS